MKKSEFIDELGEILEVENELTLQTDLTEIEAFDSLAMMSIIAMVYTKFQVRMRGDDLKKVTTVNSLIQLIGDEKFSK